MSFILSSFFFFSTLWVKSSHIYRRNLKSHCKSRESYRIRKDLKRPQACPLCLLIFYTETASNKKENTGKGKSLIFRVNTLLDSYVSFPTKISQGIQRNETRSHSMEKIKQQKLSLKKTLRNVPNKCFKQLF